MEDVPEFIETSEEAKIRIEKEMEALEKKADIDCLSEIQASLKKYNRSLTTSVTISEESGQYL